MTEEKLYQTYEILIEKLSHREIAQKIRKHHSCKRPQVAIYDG